MAYESSYSKALRWLLDLYENHGLAHRFAEGILSHIDQKATRRMDGLQIEAETEWKIIVLLYENPPLKMRLLLKLSNTVRKAITVKGKCFVLKWTDMKKHYPSDYRLTMIYLTALGDQSKSKTDQKHGFR